MRDTRTLDAMVAALTDLTGCLNSPRQDDILLQEAGIALDRALFPLLVRLTAEGTMSVAQLADRAGRDASTVSRQLNKLEQLGLVERPTVREDRRVRAAIITNTGSHALTAITQARRRLLVELIRDWSADERRMFPKLVQKLADAMRASQHDPDTAT